MGQTRGQQPAWRPRHQTGPTTARPAPDAHFRITESPRKGTPRRSTYHRPRQREGDQIGRLVDIPDIAPPNGTARKTDGRYPQYKESPGQQPEQPLRAHDRVPAQMSAPKYLAPSTMPLRHQATAPRRRNGAIRRRFCVSPEAGEREIVQWKTIRRCFRARRSGRPDEPGHPAWAPAPGCCDHPRDGADGCHDRYHAGSGHLPWR